MRFSVFPGDASGTNATLQELKDFGIPSAALAGCTEAPTPALFCLGTDVYNSAYLGTKELIERDGRVGQDRPLHRLPGRSQHAASHRRGAEGTPTRRRAWR